MRNVMRLPIILLFGFMVSSSVVFAKQAKPRNSGSVQRDWFRVIKAGLASKDKSDLSLWTVEQTLSGRGLSIEPGPMIYAGLHHTVEPFIYDLGLAGWYKIYIGFYLPKNITYTGVAAKLDNEVPYVCVADPRASLADRGKGYKCFLDADFVEVKFKSADLTDRKIVIYHPEGCRSFITHFRFVPMSDNEIVVEKAGRESWPFDCHLWLDYMDQLKLVQRPEKDWWQNSPKAVHRYVRYFCDYGGNCLGYRIMAGGRSRYNSRILCGERERYIDKRIGGDMREPWGSYRFGDIETDILGEWVKWSHFYGKKAFAVWCFEEDHGYPAFLASFNVEHPQFMGRFNDGTFHFGYACLAYPEVRRHKLAIAQEVLDRGVDGFVFDFQRIDGWFQLRDMTMHHRGLGGWDKYFIPEVIEAYKKKYGIDPREELFDTEAKKDIQVLPRDSFPNGTDTGKLVWGNRRWIRFCAQYHTQFFRELRKLCQGHERKTGREIEIVMTVPAVSKDSFSAIRAYGCDWETWVQEGLMTAMSPIIPPEDANGKKQTLDDFVEIMEYVHEKCKGRCEVIWPLAHYKRTLANLARNMGHCLAQDMPDFVERVLKLSHGHMAAGIQLTTVDYNMTDWKQSMTIDVVMRYYNSLNGPYRWRKTGH